jgi:putative transposase
MRLLSHELTQLRRASGQDWLREVPSQIPQQALVDLWHAYRQFFRGQARYPTFRSRKRDTPRFRIPQHVRVSGTRVYVPKLGWIRLRLSRPVEGPTKSATFKRDARGRWHVTLVQPFLPHPLPSHPDPPRVVGIDLGLTEFAVLSDGSRIEARQFLRRSAGRLRRAQRSFSRTQPGSRRRARARARVGNLHARVANQRRDFIHKLTTDLIREWDVIGIEDLCVRGLAKTKLSASVFDAGWSEFRRQLEYKAAWNGRTVVLADRFYPSTRRCSACGVVEGPKDLSARVWKCRCGASHDRDLNAAVNLRDVAMGRVAVGLTDTKTPVELV